MMKIAIVNVIIKMKKEIEVLMSKSETITKAWLEPETIKKCSCGLTIYKGYYYKNQEYKRIVITEIEKPATLLEPKKKIFINHFLNCPDWKKYHK